MYLSPIASLDLITSEHADMWKWTNRKTELTNTTEFNCITAGAQWTQESTISASCTYGGVPMGDTSSQDACERTGNNYSDPVGPRSALVQSSMQASLQVSSGGTGDAYVIVKSGPNMNATVVLRDTADGDDGSVFNVVNLGNQNAESRIALTDVASNALVSVVDTSSTADFLVSGNAIFGGPTAFGSRSVSVASGENATIRVISGVENAFGRFLNISARGLFCFAIISRSLKAE